jgi:hypothetical protein
VSTQNTSPLYSFRCIPGDPYHQGKAAPDDNERLFKQIRSLQSGQVFSFSCLRTGQKDCLRMGHYTVNMPSQPATVDSPVLLERGDQVNDESSGYG